MKKLIVLAMIILSMPAIAAPKNGEVKVSHGNSLMWNESVQKWQSVEQFWLDFAKNNGGLTWGMTDTYPEYDKVKEFDKILIKVPKGNCLMEFYHSRWRRANDVRRWDDKVNEYGGCPYVFD
ncbi:MAG: hypothetical protein ACPGUD_04780 [Parashewanella sp.]